MQEDRKKGTTLIFFYLPSARTMSARKGLSWRQRSLRPQRSQRRARKLYLGISERGVVVSLIHGGEKSPYSNRVLPVAVGWSVSFADWWRFMQAIL
jgi:hypothetical protein